MRSVVVTGGGLGVVTGVVMVSDHRVPFTAYW